MDYAGMGHRIRNTRVSRGWTQEMLAERVSMSVSFLGHIERGSRKASLESVINLINALEVNADSILMDSLLVAQSNMITRLNDQQKLVLREVIRVISESVDTWDD